MPSLIPVDSLLGATLIGVLLSAIVFGITLLQAYLYYTEYSSDDPRLLKRFVAFLIVVGACHVALTTHTLYYYTITNFGDYTALLTCVWSLLISVPVGNLSSVAVQWFFAYRVYCFSAASNKWLPLIICALSLGHFTCGLGYAVDGFLFKLFSADKRNIAWVAGGLSFALACDFTITISMVYYQRKARTEFLGSSKAMTKWVTYTLNTCFLTSVFTFTCLVVFAFDQGALIYAPFYFIAVHLYSAAFVSTLNCRRYVRAAMDTSTGDVISLAMQRAGDLSSADARSGDHSDHDLAQAGDIKHADLIFREVA